MGGRWPHLQKSQGGDPGKTTWKETARREPGLALEPWAKLRADIVTVRWQHMEVETISRMLEARVSGGPVFSL